MVFLDLLEINLYIDILLSYNINHISAYALTVEPKTALKRYIDKGIIDDVETGNHKNSFIFYSIF